MAEEEEKKTEQAEEVKKEEEGAKEEAPVKSYQSKKDKIVEDTLKKTEEATKKLEEANKKAEEMAGKREEQIKEFERQGRSVAGFIPPEKKKDTPQEYAEKVRKGEVNPLKDDGFI